MRSTRRTTPMTKTAPKILIVDDDAKLRDLLQSYLQDQGLDAHTVGDVERARRQLQLGHFDLTVLDLMLPGTDGLSFCRQLRAEGFEIPVLILTGRGDEVDRIIGLEMGADDYLPKPCNPRELLARIHSILRRTRPVIPGDPARKSGTFHFGEFTLDTGQRQLLKDGKLQRLSTSEFTLLEALVSRPRRTQTREQLLNIVRGRDYDTLSRSIDVHISRLRKLLEEDPGNPRYIQTVWGYGYVFVPDDEPTT